MKRVFVGLAACLLVALPVLAGQASEEASDVRTLGPIQSLGDAPQWPGPEGAVLFDNGPISNSAGTGANGEDESILETLTLLMNTLGFGHQVVNNNRVADDFTVPTGDTWNIGNITFFAYQTGSTFDSSMTAVNVQIWDGVPGEIGSNVVCGDDITNRLFSTGFSNVLRVTETTTGVATDRPIMANRTSLRCQLTSGTYWVDWQTDGTLASGPWAPPIAILGSDTTGDARQSIDGGPYDPIEDSGSLTPQGLPFIIEESMGIQLGIVGSCPGTITLNAKGGTPGGNAGIIFSANTGSDALGGGPCAGEVTGLDNPQFFTVVPLDGDGAFSIDRTAPQGVCGLNLQLVDPADSCTISPVAQLP